MDIGTILYERRNQKGLSQEELSFIIGVSRQSIYKWESNISFPTIDHFIKIMKILQFDLCIVNNKVKVIYK